jgi:general secretion pathway protein D
VGDPARRALSLRRGAGLLALLAPALLVPALAAAQAPRSAPVPIYGIELDALGERERVLVFAEQPLEGRLLEPSDPETLLVVIPGAVLDDSAPARVAGAPGAGVRMVTAQEALGAAGPEVRLQITRTPGPPAELTRRGATLAVELARPRRAREGGIPMKFTSANLAEVVEKVGRATGQRFIYDDALQGLVTLTSAQPVSSEEALELLHTVLLMKGFAAVPTPSGARKILPLGEGAAGAPWTTAAPGGQSDAVTATLVHLRAADAEQLVSMLQPWVGASALAIPHPPSNAVILAGSEARLRELLRLVGAIDQSSDFPLVVRRLRHRSAAEAAEMLLAAFGKADPARPGVEAWPDERTGALVLRAPPEQMAEARAFLAEIDRPVRGRGEVEVIPMRYADPESMAELLSGLQGGAGAAPARTSFGAEGGITAQSAAGAESLEGRQYAIAVHVPTHALVLNSDPETLGILQDVIDELDRPPPTIEVELIVLQVITDTSVDLGFDAFIPLTTPNSPDDLIASVLMNPSGGGLLQPGEGSGPAFAARFTRSPLVLPFVDTDGNPQSLLVPRTTAVLTANDGRIDTTTLAHPHLRMLSGEEQEIFAGNNIPIPVSTSDTPTTATLPGGLPTFVTSRSIERQDVGVSLRVKPTVGEAGGVRLELEAEVTSLAPSQVSSLAGSIDEVGPTIRERKLTSTIHLRDGEFAVVGFAREQAYDRTSVGVPWLMDIPILGWAFKTTRDRNVTSRVVIAAQARILRTPDEQVADTIRHRLAFERSIQRRAAVPLSEETFWALRVATVSDPEAAQAIATRLGTQERPAQVSRWESSGGPVYDVTLSRFATLSEANEVALRLREQGWDPDPLALPVEQPPDE